MRPDLFVNRQREIDEIITRIKFQTQSSAVSGDSGLGKTALLRYLAHPRTLKKYQLPGEEFKCIYFRCPDMRERPQYAPIQFWQEIFSRLARQITDAELVEHIRGFQSLPAFDYYAVEEFFYGAKRKHLSIVLLLDDFDNLLSNAAFDKYFLWSLKNLAHNNVDYSFGLVIATLQRLSELCQDLGMTSPFFNIFSSLPLAPLPAAEAGVLLQNMRRVQRRKVAADHKEQEQAFKLIAGIPLVIRLLGQFCREASTLAQLVSGQRKPAWRAGHRLILRRFVQRIWVCSGTGEKQLLQYLAKAWAENNEGRLNHEQEETIMQHHTRAWQALEKRGLMQQMNSVFSLFPDLFAEFVLKETFVVAPSGAARPVQHGA